MPQHSTSPKTVEDFKNNLKAAEDAKTVYIDALLKRSPKKIIDRQTLNDYKVAKCAQRISTLRASISNTANYTLSIGLLLAVLGGG